MPAEIRVKGLAELRRALRDVGDGMPKALTKALKRTADVALPVARSNFTAPSGTLRDSLKSFARGTSAGLRSRLVYAGVQEFGGAIQHNRAHGHSGPHIIRIKGQKAAARGLESKRDEAIQILSNEIDQLARNAGWS